MIDDTNLQKFESSWHLGILSNGIKVVHIPTKNDQRLFLSTLFATGARDEPVDLLGISHFLEHMMFRGSKSHPSFLSLADAFEWLGGHWNAETGLEHTEYTYSGIVSTTGEAVKLFADFLSHPKLLDIELEREVILREIEDELNEFGLSADLDWHAANLMWPKSGLGNPIAGTLDSVQHVNLRHLQDYRMKNYSCDRMAICVAASLKPEQVTELLEKHFSSYPLAAKRDAHAVAAPERFVGPSYRFVEHTDNQYHILIGFSCEGEWSTKTAAYELICRILADSFSSRLTLRLREELGLVYDVSCDESLATDAGMIAIQAQATPDKLIVVIKEICKIVNRLRKDGPTVDELEKAKLRAGIRIALATHEPDQLAFRLAWNYLHDRESSLRARIAKITDQTPDGLKLIVDELFRSEACALVVMGPKDESLESKVKETIQKYL